MRWGGQDELSTGMQKRLKIIYVITKSNWGGAQRYVFDLATNLPQEQFNVAVAAGGDGDLVKKLNTADIKTITIPRLQRDINVWREALSLFSLFSIFKKERPDIVHLNSSKGGGLGALAARLAGVPKIIFTVHGWAFHEERPTWQRLAIIFFSRLTGRFQHRLIHVTKKDFNATIAYKIAPVEKAALIPLGITPPDFLPKDKAREFLSERIGRQIPEDSTLIGTVAELTKNKGLTHLIDAANRVKIQDIRHKIQVIVIGEGEERNKLQNQIHTLGLKDSVALAGFIPNAARYLKAFDIFVLPSIKEGMPYTLLEALHAGVPIAAAAVGGVPDAITHQKNGILVPPKDPKALAEAIISRRDRLLVSRPECFSLTEMVEKTIALYES